MRANEFINLLEKNKINFFTGVPDSLLSTFCGHIINKYGVNNCNHIIANNEGGSVALASGYYLSTNHIPCVYMQNSGIGNALNPVASLTHPLVYGIPILYVIGWRGEPHTNDEPQHIFQGMITLKLLESLGITCYIIDENTSFGQVENTIKDFVKLFAMGQSAAFIIKKNAFTGEKMFLKTTM